MFKRIFSSIGACHVSLLFIGLMFLIPFVITHHEQPIPSFYPEWAAGALGLVAIFPLLFSTAWHTTQTPLRKTSLKIPQASLIFIGLAAILCVQWALGMLHSNRYALSVLSYFIWAFLLTVLGSHLRRELGWEKLVATLAWCLIIAGIINIGIVVLQFVMRTGGVIPFLPNLGGYGALSQPNHFADFCALATASLIYLYAKGHFSLSFFSLLLVCFIVMLSLSGSRSVWLYLTAFTVLITMMHINIVKRGEDTKRSRDAWRTGLMLLPAFILIQLFIYYIFPNELVSLPTERLVDSFTEHTSSLRLQFWHDSFRIFLLHPWLGVGAEKFRVTTFLLVDSPTALTSKYIFENAHNLFLHLLAEMGIGALLIVLAGLWGWCRAFKWNKLNLETWWLVSLFAVLGIHSMLEYPLWFTFFLGVGAVLLGAGDENLIPINLSKLSSKLTRLSFLLVLILGAANLSIMLTADIKLESWLHKLAYENINEQAPLDWARRNSSLSPYAEALRAMTMGNIDDHDVSEEVLLHQSVMNFRPEYTVTYQLALLLKLQGQHADAVKQLNRALLAYPEKFKVVLENTPEKYRQEYLDLLSETRPDLHK